MDVLSPLLESPFDVFLCSFSALDRYYRYQSGHIVHVSTNAGIVDLAKLYSPLEFHGIDGIDAVYTRDESIVLFSTADSYFPAASGSPFSAFSYDPRKKKFFDPESLYGHLRTRKLDGNLFPQKDERTWHRAAEIAVLCARYGFEITHMEHQENGRDFLSAFEQRCLLIRLLGARDCKTGFQLLMKNGFIKNHWPEIQKLNETDQGKEYHPEGNVWKHTLETFSHLKRPSLLLGCALLLHDCGKPESTVNKEKKFDNHAQIGKKIGVKFLARLGFSRAFQNDVYYLVGNHMLPAALPNIPAQSASEIMTHPLFPILMELYRCDLQSSFRGPENFYRVCNYIKKVKKNVDNPYRNVDGVPIPDYR